MIILIIYLSWTGLVRFSYISYEIQVLLWVSHCLVLEWAKQAENSFVDLWCEALRPNSSCTIKCCALMIFPPESWDFVTIRGPRLQWGKVPSRWQEQQRERGGAGGAGQAPASVRGSAATAWHLRGCHQMEVPSCWLPIPPASPASAHPCGTGERTANGSDAPAPGNGQNKSFGSLVCPSFAVEGEGGRGESGVSCPCCSCCDGAENAEVMGWPWGFQREGSGCWSQAGPQAGGTSPGSRFGCCQQCPSAGLVFWIKSQSWHLLKRV